MLRLKITELVAGCAMTACIFVAVADMGGPVTGQQSAQTGPRKGINGSVTQKGREAPAAAVTGPGQTRHDPPPQIKDTLKTNVYAINPGAEPPTSGEPQQADPAVQTDPAPATGDGAPGRHFGETAAGGLQPGASVVAPPVTQPRDDDRKKAGNTKWRPG